MKDEALTMSSIKALPDAIGAVRVQVVPNHVDGAIWISPGDFLHERHQVGLSAAVGTACKHVPGMHVQRSGQCLCAVANVLKLLPAQARRARSSIAMFALDGLNACLLVDAQHHRALGRTTVQRANGVDLLPKLRIWAVQPLPNSVWT